MMVKKNKIKYMGRYNIIITVEEPHDDGPQRTQTTIIITTTTTTGNTTLNLGHSDRQPRLGGNHYHLEGFIVVVSAIVTAATAANW